MSLPKNQAWFAAKTHGYGWGWPLRWQGWVVLGLYVAALGAGLAWLAVGRKHPAYFTIYVGALSGLLTLFCWWKGEPPRWRWGGD